MNAQVGSTAGMGGSERSAAGVAARVVQDGASMVLLERDNER